MNAPVLTAPGRRKILVGEEIVLYGDVGDMWGDGSGFTDREVLEALAEIGGRDVTVRLNSGGGLAWQGVAIYNALTAYPGKVSVHIDAIAASAASVIAMAGTDITMMSGAMMMIHDPSAVTWGDSERHRKAADTLDRLGNVIAGIYAKRTGESVDEMRDLMLAETWMDADEAITRRFATSKDDAAAKAVSSFDYRAYGRAPSRLLEAQRMRPDQSIPKHQDGAMNEINVIRSRCIAAKLSDSETTAVLASAGNGPDALVRAQDAILEALMARDPGTPNPSHRSPTFTLDDPQNFVAAAGEAIFARLAPSHTPSGPARELMGMRIADIAREAEQRRGVRGVRQMNDNTVITNALHTTSDFPQILGDAVGRVLQVAYNTVPSALKAVARMVTLNDFRARTFLQLSQFATLERVDEGGEYNRGTFSESGEKVSLATFGKIFGISRQALVNDDIGAFADIGPKLGRAAAQFEATQLADLLQAGSGLGPLMADGKRLFHADHGNLLAGGGDSALSPVSISNCRLAMRRQVDSSGQLIGISPKYLVVGPEMETIGEQVLAIIAAAEPAKVNPFAGRLSLVVEPRITGKGWYLTAEPGEVDGLVYAYLSGATGPQIDTRAGFEIDGMEMRVRLDFGAAFIDHRGWYRSPGQ